VDQFALTSHRTNSRETVKLLMPRSSINAGHVEELPRPTGRKIPIESTVTNEEMPIVAPPGRVLFATNLLKLARTLTLALNWPKGLTVVALNVTGEA
jgi:hypothetical protein